MIKELVILKSRVQKSFRKKIFTVIGILILFVISWYIAYYSGGTKYVWGHIVYIPILISAFIFNVWGGFLSGLIAGLIMMGPVMPLDVLTGEVQRTSDWIIRLLFFIIFGSFSGEIFTILLKQVEKIKQQLYYDCITKLSNKISLEKDLKNIISQKKGEKEVFLVTLTIENYFEIINIVGHNQEKHLLEILGKHIEKYIGKNRKLYISYNNKFEIIFLDLDKTELLKWIKRFSNFLRNPILLNEIYIHLKTALGISIYPSQSKNVEELIQKSYIAAENAKKMKLEYKLYDGVLEEKALERLILLGELKKAIKENEFELYYQPKLDLKTGKINAAEALIRWNHPKKGFVSLSDFIPQTEDTHLITPLTYWVFDNAVQTLKKIQNQGFDINIAVNLVGRNFDQADFVDRLMKILDHANIKPQNIELELTERDIMKDDLKTKKMINKLNEKGFKISIDDFGTGYSSLAYLNRLPTKIVKIDRSLVSDIHKDNEKRVITTAIIKMIHGLGKKVVAEGIEKKEELDILKSLKCDCIQGYYISKPLKEEEFLAMIQEELNY